MTKCGIPMYDSLPASVGFTDVDAIRARLSDISKQRKKIVEQEKELLSKLDGVYQRRLAEQLIEGEK